MGTALRVLAILFSLAAGVGVGFAAYELVPGAKTASEPTAAASPKPSAHDGNAARAAPSSSASPGAGAIASTSPQASAPEAAAATEDPAKCLPMLFAPGTFPTPPDLSEVCTGKKVTDIAKHVKAAVVKASGGHVNDGMQEWAVLGIHEIAAVAAMRGRCCPNADPLDVPKSPGSCPPVGDVLTEIEHASRKGAPDEDIDTVVAHFDSTARCIVRSGDTGAFGGVTSLDGGETTMFQKILHRAQGTTTSP